MWILYMIAYLIVGFFVVRWTLRKIGDKGTPLSEIIIMIPLFPLILIVMLFIILDEKIVKF